MRKLEDQSKLPSDHDTRERACPDDQGEEAPAEEWLDIILRPALKLALGDAEPTTLAWTRIRESLLARRQDLSASEEE
jgi:hypothetical protein